MTETERNDHASHVLLDVVQFLRESAPDAPVEFRPGMAFVAQIILGKVQYLQTGETLTLERFEEIERAALAEVPR
jgi:hypothetical protein